jgi:hypothetical protein
MRECAVIIMAINVNGRAAEQIARAITPDDFIL